MANPQKRKGSAWELKIVKALQDFGFHLRGGNYGAGRTDDIGDIHLGAILISAKNWTQLALAGWVDEAYQQTVNAGLTIPVVWHHRKGHADPRDGYVTMSGSTFMTLVAGSEWAPRESWTDQLGAGTATGDWGALRLGAQVREHLRQEEEGRRWKGDLPTEQLQGSPSSE
jgi:hypothetical protein